MLELRIPDTEWYNDNTNEFIMIKGGTLKLEHSLLSISRWEEKYKKSYLNSNDKTPEEILDYIKCMTVNKNVDQRWYNILNKEHIIAINDYLKDSHTASIVHDNNPKHKRRNSKSKFITSEEIYSYMVGYGIPFECEKWNFNRLWMLIQIVAINNDAPNNKMSKRDILKQNAALNAARRKKPHL